MENNIIKQAKSDIFKELYPIIKFYIKKGANAKSLKKYYKNEKRFKDILEDIKNKGINLVKDESEYNKIVKSTLNEILDDFIAKEKDEEYKNKQVKNNNKKMKHIKEFFDFNDTAHGVIRGLLWLGTGYFTVKFLKGFLKDIRLINMSADDLKNRKKEINNRIIEIEYKSLYDKLSNSDGEDLQYTEDYGKIYIILGEFNIVIDKLKKTIEWWNINDDNRLYRTFRPIPISEQEIKELKDALENDKNGQYDENTKI